MNVVPRSTKNTNGVVVVKVLLEPMNKPLSVSPSKGNQGTTRGQKIFSLPRVVP